MRRGKGRVEEARTDAPWYPLAEKGFPWEYPSKGVYPSVSPSDETTRICSCA